MILTIIDWLKYLGTVPFVLGLSLFCVDSINALKFFRDSIMTLGLVHFLKIYVRRPRPYMLHPEFLKVVKDVHDYGSFPSAHTAVISIFCITLFMYMHSKTHSKWCYLIFMPILFVAFSRWYMGLHYISDCIGGIICAGFVYFFNRFIDTYGN